MTDHRVAIVPSKRLQQLFRERLEKLPASATPAKTQAEFMFAVGQVLDEMQAALRAAVKP